MQLYFDKFSPQKPFLASLILHLAVLVYLLQSYNSPVQIPAQQMIQISLIAAGVPENAKPVTAKPKIQKPILQNKTIAVSKPEIPKQAVEQQEVAALEPKSGVTKNSKVNTDSVVTKPIFSADYLDNPAPKYPESAKRRKQQGSVMLKVEVSSAGKAAQVSVESSSGSDILDQSAIEAVSRWKFIPAKRDDEFVTASVIVPIEFRLE